MAYTRERFNVLAGDEGTPAKIRAALQRVQRSIPQPAYTMDLRDFGVTSKPNDYASEINGALRQATPGDAILCPFATYAGSTLQNTAADVSIVGHNIEQHGIYWTGGASVFLQNGTDDGQPLDANEYNGPQGFTLRNLFLRAWNPVAPLSNGLANYTSGSTGLRDWRGGSILLDRVMLRGFDSPYVGNQSDINEWRHLFLFDNHAGMYVGPRSDQLTVTHCWSFHNDTTWQFVGARNPVLNHWISDTDGSSTTNPVVLKSYGTRNAAGVVFNQPWLENVAGGTQDVDAFFEVGIGDATEQGLLTINQPHITTNFHTTVGVPHTFYLFKADNARAVVVRDPMGESGIPYTNLRGIYKVVNTGAPRVKITDAEARLVRTGDNFGSGVVRVRVETPDYTLPTFNATAGATGPVTLLIDDYEHPTFATLTSSGSATVGTNSAGATLTLNGPAGSAIRRLFVKTASVNRWSIGGDGSTESGANVGTDWLVNRYADDGSFLDSVLQIVRASGTTIFNKIVNIGSSSAGASLNLNGPAADANRRTFGLTNGVNRWSWGLDNSSESGSNAGADFILNAYSDAGAFLATVLRGKRASQTFNGALTHQGTTKVASYTALTSDSFTAFRFDCTTGALVITVASTFPVGWTCDILKVDGSANSLTVSGTACTFNGAASLTTSTQYKGWKIVHSSSGAYELHGTY